jgi:hypothetical protein
MRKRGWLAIVVFAPLALMRVGLADEHHGDGHHGDGWHGRGGHEEHEEHEEHERREHEGFRYYPNYGVNPYFVNPYGGQPNAYPYDPLPDDGFGSPYDGPYVEPPGYGY